MGDWPTASGGVPGGGSATNGTTQSSLKKELQKNTAFRRQLNHLNISGY